MARQALQRFFAHLEPGGVLAMQFMILWQEGKLTQADWRLTGEVVRPEDGALVRRWSRASYDVENQLQHTEDRYEVTIQGKVIAAEYHQQSPATRWYTPAQALSLYEETGFTHPWLLEGRNTLSASAKELIFTVSGRKP